MKSERQVPIWFFVGSLVLVYGVLIFCEGLREYVFPPPEQGRVVLFEYHAGIWWGALMTVFGLFYFIRFNPWTHHETITGEEEPEEPTQG